MQELEQRRVATLEESKRSSVTTRRDFSGNMQPWAKAHGYSQWTLRGQILARLETIYSSPILVAEIKILCL
jgi:hypothetical protein